MRLESPIPTPSRRPRGVRPVCLLLAAVALANLFSAARAVLLAPQYTALGVTFPPLLAAAGGLLWGMGFLWAAWCVWHVRNRSPRPVFLFVSAYGLYSLIWWRAFATADYARARWPFAALATAVLVVLFILVVYRLRRRALAQESNTAELNSCPDRL